MKKWINTPAGRFALGVGTAAVTIGLCYGASYAFDLRDWLRNRRAEKWLLENIPDYRGNGEYDEGHWDGFWECGCDGCIDGEDFTKYDAPNYDDLDEEERAEAEYYGAIDPQDTAQDELRSIERVALSIPTPGSLGKVDPA